MTISYVGNLSIGAALPGAATAATAGISGIGAALPDILARIAALQAFIPSPVNFGEMLTLAQQTVVSIQSGIALGLPAPDISAQIAAIEALIAALLAAVSAVNAQLNVVVDFQGLLAAAGLHVYAYAGAVNAAGSEISTALATGLPAGSGGAAASSGLLLITESGATWTAMSSVFQVAP
jgi:hypothetical protein